MNIDGTEVHLPVGWVVSKMDSPESLPLFISQGLSLENDE